MLKRKRLQNQSTWGEFMKWMETGDLAELHAEVLSSMDERALTICDNVLIRSDLTREFEARMRLLKGRIYASLNIDKGLDQIQRGLKLAKGVIDDKDSEIIAARQVLEASGYTKTDIYFVGTYLEKLDELKKKADETGDKDSKPLAPGWKVLDYVSIFDAEVNVDGLACYFANTQGEDAKLIISAFKEFDAELAITVERAFAIFQENRSKHAESMASRAPKYKLYDILPAGDAPGRFEGDETIYRGAESAYVSQAQDIYPKLAEYIRTHQKDFTE